MSFFLLERNAAKDNRKLCSSFYLEEQLDLLVMSAAADAVNNYKTSIICSG